MTERIIYERISRNIKFLRTYHGLTQDKLAAKIRESRTTLGYYETYDHDNKRRMKIPVVIDVCNLFNVSLDDYCTVDFDDDNISLYKNRPTQVMIRDRDEKIEALNNQIQILKSDINGTKSLLQDRDEKIKLLNKDIKSSKYKINAVKDFLL